MAVEKIVFIGLLTVLVTGASEGTKILAMYPTPSLSHQVVFRPLMFKLAKNHEVVVITTDAVTDPPENYTQIDVHDISYNHCRTQLHRVDLRNLLTFLNEYLRVLEEIVELQYKSPEVQHLLNSNQKFDLVFAEAYLPLAFALAHIFRSPLISFSSISFWSEAEIFGAANHPLFFPEIKRRRLYNLTLGEKLNVMVQFLATKSIESQHELKNDGILKKLFGDNFPTTRELALSADMMFLGVNRLWDDNRPVPPSVIYTGVLHMKPPKELPTDLQSYMDNSKHGVIYMSFGTNLDPTSLPPERIQVFCKVFSELPYDVLWKWNGDELPGKPDNVRISKWLPQSDLLKHPNMKLFITQAGMQSTDEAIMAGVPLIAFPLLGDQWYNAEKYEHFGIGKKLEFETVTEDILKRTIQTVVEDKKYKESITRLGALMRDQPQSPLQRAVWWTEHVLRHRGAAHLRSAAANVSWTDYLMLDVVLVLLSALLLTVFLLVLFLYKILRVLRILPQKLNQKRA